MKFAGVALVFCVLGVANATHPIEKVIKLIEGLKGDSIAQGQTEQVDYEKFVYWCTTSKDALSSAIADENEAIDELTDKLAGLNKQKETLEDEIETLEGEIKDLMADAKAAKDTRKKEAGLYKKANNDLGSTIKGVEGCIKALEGAESSTEKLLLAQHHVRMVLSLVSLEASEEQRSALQSFAQKPKQLAKGDLAAHVDKYDFKSENVIELLKNLLLKFEDDKLAGTKAETNAINAYDLAKNSRDAMEKAARLSKSKKSKQLGETKKNIAKAESKLDQEESDHKADSKTLSDTNDACRIKKEEWAARSETRKLELEAMDKAVEILAKSAGVRTKAPGNPVPPPSPASFLQVLQVRGLLNDPKMKAVAFLKEAAQSSHSRALEQLAVEVAAHLNGPFGAVNNMIEKMIFRLMDEQKQEDEHKLWCDQEIKKTDVMITDKEDKIAELKAEIGIETAAVANLKEEIKAANKMISDIIAFVNEATEIRKTGKSENAAAVKDSQKAQKSLANAISVLEAFYKDSGAIEKEPWEFIQKPVKLPKNPSTWGPSYTGKGNTGIIAILETVMTDFATMEADTKAQEAADQKEFEDTMKDNSIEKAGRTQEVTMKTSEMKSRNAKIADLSSNKKDTEGELEKTEQYLSDLQKPCVDTDTGASYDKRKAARSTEITALKKAQGILEDAFKEKAASFLQRK